MRNVNENSKETQAYDEYSVPTIVWLGDNREKTLTEKLSDQLDSSPAWYWLTDGTKANGPFDTSTDAFNAYQSTKVEA